MLKMGGFGGLSGWGGLMSKMSQQQQFYPLYGHWPYNIGHDSRIPKWGHFSRDKYSSKKSVIFPRPFFTWQTNSSLVLLYQYYIGIKASLHTFWPSWIEWLLLLQQCGAGKFLVRIYHLTQKSKEFNRFRGLNFK